MPVRHDAPHRQGLGSIGVPPARNRHDQPTYRPEADAPRFKMAGCLGRAGSDIWVGSEAPPASPRAFVRQLAGKTSSPLADLANRPDQGVARRAGAGFYAPTAAPRDESVAPPPSSVFPSVAQPPSVAFRVVQPLGGGPTA